MYCDTTTTRPVTAASNLHGQNKIKSVNFSSQNLPLSLVSSVLHGFCKVPFTLEINFKIYVNQFLSQENFQCEQSAFKKNKFKNPISQFRTCSILRNFVAEISLIEHCDWSIGIVYKHRYEMSTMLLPSGFRKFISSVKCAHFQNKNLEIFLSKWNFELISNVKGPKSE